MYLQDLQLSNFRNFGELSVSFSPGLNVIHGENGAGKTNLFEAIYYCAILRSHRKRRDDELVTFGTDFFKILAVTAQGTRLTRFEIVYGKDQIPSKRVWLNGAPVERLSSMVGEFKSVILSFDDLTLVSGPPYHRRRFLDILLSEMSSSYLADIIAYRRVLQQRNRLLWEMKTNRKKDAQLLESWDSQLIELGSRIVSKRREISEGLFGLVAKYCGSLGIRSRVKLLYVPSFSTGNSVKESFERALMKEREREFQRSQTLIGPHRDEIQVSLDGVSLRSFGSCGQQRLVAVAMRFAEAGLLHEFYKDPPIVMLDEILGELDLQTREKVLTHLRDYRQVLIASVSPLLMDDPDASHYSLVNGVLEWKK